MAQLISFALYDDNAAPLLGATPTFSVYRDKTLVARTAPSIVELGAGLYGFLASESDYAVGTAYRIVSGAGASPATLCGAIHKPDAPFLAFEFLDSAGALYVGGVPPTIPSWQNSAGVEQTPPGINALGSGGFYVLVPTSTDITEGRAFLIAAPVDGLVPGISPNSYGGALQGEGGDVGELELANFVPPANPFSPLEFDVIRGDEPIARLLVIVHLPQTAEHQLALDGSTFQPGYGLSSSSIAPNATGYHVKLFKTGGWPTGTASVDVFDAGRVGSL